MDMKKAIELLTRFNSATLRYRSQYDRTGNLRELEKAATELDLSTTEILEALSGRKPTNEEMPLFRGRQ